MLACLALVLFVLCLLSFCGLFILCLSALKQRTGVIAAAARFKTNRWATLYHQTALADAEHFLEHVAAASRSGHCFLPATSKELDVTVALI